MTVRLNLWHNFAASVGMIATFSFFLTLAQCELFNEWLYTSTGTYAHTPFQLSENTHIHRL
jgi:hypothetical protein